MDKLILDATCGSRMIWFNKNNELAVFIDERELDDEKIWTSGDGKAKRFCSIHPDIKASFTDIPFPDDTFYHIIFDPPHLVEVGDTAWMAKKYGKLDKDNWRQTLHDGFAECMRVLKPYGTLIFKWNETQIPVKEVIRAIGQEPLYGNRSGKQNKTHWMAFIKTMEGSGVDESRRNCSKARSKTDAGREWIEQKYIARNDSADIKGRNQETGEICSRAY